MKYIVDYDTVLVILTRKLGYQMSTMIYNIFTCMVKDKTKIRRCREIILNCITMKYV